MRDYKQEFDDFVKKGSGGCKRFLHSINDPMTEEEFYLYYYNIDKPVCMTCGKPVKFLRFKLGFRKFCCSKCSNSNMEKIVKGQQWSKDPKLLEKAKSKRIETNLNKYGVLSFTQS